MNLNAYDNINEKIDKNKTWIDIKRKVLYSREIKYRPYYSLMKRYDSKLAGLSFFIAMLDKPDKNKICFATKKDDYGRVKLNLHALWHSTYLYQLENNCNIDVTLVDANNDGDVYFLDI